MTMDNTRPRTWIPVFFAHERLRCAPEPLGAKKPE
jgi:hypothetical protein